MNIIILGQQGSGKGTQASLLAEKMNLIHIDMGLALREVAKTDTALGREIYKIQNITKTLVSSRILREVLHLKLGSIPPKQGIVFDGVPRTLDQAEYIKEALHDFGRRIDKVFFISIQEAESIRRIIKRRTCEACKLSLIMGKDIYSDDERCPKCGGKIIQRSDDTAEGIKKRLEIFREETLPVIEHYFKDGLAVMIDGEHPMEDVFKKIINSVEDICL